MWHITTFYEAARAVAAGSAAHSLELETENECSAHALAVQPAIGRCLQNLRDIQAREKRAADELTPRELQIARLASGGLSYKQVAMQLTIKSATVRTHLSAIYDKLEVRKQAEMVALLDEAQ